MTAARLEELARVCDVALADNDATHLLSDEIRDLARCARGWAKVEAAMRSNANPIELMGYRGRITPWSFYLNGVLGPGRATGPTALEAVEAAEVKP